MLELTNTPNASPKTCLKKTQQAVILAAGLGSRLAKASTDIKPLKNVGGQSLIHRNIELLAQSGIKEVIIVTGYHADELKTALLHDCKHIPVKLTFSFNPDYRKSNGLSVLCAQKHVEDNFLLMMADHLFEPSIIEEAASIIPQENAAILCVDYKVNQIFDIDDATKVCVKNGKVSDIGKEISRYNAIDTGLFICTTALFDALEEAAKRSPIHDVSLSEGIAHFMKGERMFVHDIGQASWQDVDDEMMLQEAERFVRRQAKNHRSVAIA